MTVTPTRFLHVANGTSVTTTLEAAGVPGRYSIWADPLHDGPVPDGLSDAELLEVRTRHLSAPSPYTPPGGIDPAQDSANDMRAWRRVIAYHESYEEMVLWFEHDLFDQLNLIQLLTFVRDHAAAKKVSLVCIGSFPGRRDFKGLGELRPDELGPLLETRAPVNDSQYSLAARAWHAFRQPTPEALDALRSEDTSALPYLADAMTRFLQEYPWTRDGLSRSERRLLELARDEGIVLWAAFPRMGDGDRFYTITDLSLLDIVDTLATAAPPLLTVEVTADSPRPFRRTVRATEFGRSVLAGAADRVFTCGLDRWFGGVHVAGRHGVWRWDDGRQRMVRA